MEGQLIDSSVENETDDDYYDDGLYKIKSWGADLSFRELVSMYEEGELIKPEIQRKYVWDKIEASRFIDSILLGLPVPSIFLAKDKNENKIIVDGYQRIMTIYDFINGLWSGDNSVFKLSKSKKINNKWSGKSFNELDAHHQKKIKSTTIHAIIFEQTHPKDEDTSLYQIFERINTSGKTLVPQEIRNCIYQGKLNSLMINLNKNKNWRILFTGSDDKRKYTIEEQRMKDIEFILRFFSIYEYVKREERPESLIMKKYLNIFMGDKNNNKETSIEKFNILFTKTMSHIYTHMGKNAFRKDNSQLFHPTIFDSISIATAQEIFSNNALDWTGRRAKKDNVLKDEEYITYISRRTTDDEHIIGRINKVKHYLFGYEQ